MSLPDREPSAARVALACLVHPWSLLALVVLAFNDHWWKGIGPGAITGKLSDLAGLFFFPFVVLALTAIWPRRHGAIRTGRVAFAVVAAWFAAAKTIPAVHAGTVALASALFGPVEVVRDPTDVLALVALIPAWRLYRRCANELPIGLRALRVPALAMALLLTAATSRPAEPVVRALVVHDGDLLAVMADTLGHPAEAYRTRDGETWHRDDSFPTDRALARHHAAHEVEVDGRVFRRADHAVLTRDNGGWRPVWAISEGRRAYMRMHGYWSWRTTDIAVVPARPDVVVVALGTEGIVVRTAEGHWQRRGIGPVDITPPRASLIVALELVSRGQWVFGLAAMLIAWTLITFLTWSSPPPANPLPEARAGAPAPLASLRAAVRAIGRTLANLRWSWRFALATAAALVLPVVAIASFAEPTQQLPEVTGMLGAVLLAVPALPLLLGWQRFLREARPLRTSMHVGPAALAGVSAVAALLAWDLGWIDSLRVAVAIGCAGIALVVARHTARLGRG